MREENRKRPVLVCTAGILVLYLVLGILAGGREGVREAGDLVEGTVRKEQSAAETDSEIHEEAPKVALTFDDGPHPVWTEKLLDGLKERGIHATFFLIGSNIPGNEELVKRMEEEGHLIGNHTYSHVKMDSMDILADQEELEKTNSLVKAITGKNTEYIRPPFGAWNKEMEHAMDVFSVLWDVDTLDWTTCNVQEIVKRGVQDTKDGDIILMHDCYESSVEAALEIADILTAQGYEFVTADEMILD